MKVISDLRIFKKKKKKLLLIFFFFFFFLNLLGPADYKEDKDIDKFQHQHSGTALGDIDQDRPDEDQDEENDVKVFGKDHPKVGELAETLFSTVESEIERVRQQTGLHRYDLHRQQPYSGYGPKQKQSSEKKVNL